MMRTAGHTRKNLALAAMLWWVSNLAYGENLAAPAPAMTECPRAVMRKGLPPEGKQCLQLNTREERGPLLVAQMSLSERVDLVARDVRSEYSRYAEAVRAPPGSGVLDTWSLIGGFVLLIAFSGMRRRQLFRDG
jgi:hypothetical protein